MKINALAATLLAIFAASLASADGRNIIFILADDLGWNDVGFHNNHVKTQNIDRLARQGIIMNNSYVQSVCSPSRSALMTGVYPFRDGLSDLFSNNAVKCVPFHRNFLPEKLKELGYTTHMVGKWHLGFCSLNCTPTFRGFDSFLGFYTAYEGYFSKRHEHFLDFRKDTEPVFDSKYSTTIYGKRAVEIIETHNNSKPLFLYLPFQAPHCPLEVPDEFLNLYPPIKNERRRIYSAMVSAMDKAIGTIVNALKRRGMYEDTLIIFSSDNGGMPNVGGNNYPLRGAKMTLFEGGTRAVGFVHGNGLIHTGKTFNGLFHIVDWLPTIYVAAGGNITGLGDEIDGVNQWDAIRTFGMSSRNEIVYDVKTAYPLGTDVAAIRIGDYKLIIGYPGSFQDWYKAENEYFTYMCEGIEFLSFLDNMTTRDIRQRSFLFSAKMLFNLKDDPSERNDISAIYPDIVDELSAKLNNLRRRTIPPGPVYLDPDADPNLYGGYWSPGWC